MKLSTRRGFGTAIFLMLLCTSFFAASFGPVFAGGNSNTTPLAVGASAPDFSLAAHDGKTVKLSKGYGHAKTVIVFYRGSWCPFCVRQLSELRTLVQPGEHINLYAVSVDPVEKSKALATKIGSDGKGEFNFQILSDPNHAVIDAWGVHDPAYDGKQFDGIPHPAIFILDKKGKIAWAKVEPDYKKRPTIAELRAALDATK
jgi:peroxiredoxin